jgi:hypothetical protein
MSRERWRLKGPRSARDSRSWRSQRRVDLELSERAKLTPAALSEAEVTTTARVDPRGDSFYIQYHQHDYLHPILDAAVGHI